MLLTERLQSIKRASIIPRLADRYVFGRFAFSFFAWKYLLNPPHPLRLLTTGMRTQTKSCGASRIRLRRRSGKRLKTSEIAKAEIFSTKVPKTEVRSPLPPPNGNISEIGMEQERDGNHFAIQHPSKGLPRRFSPQTSHHKDSDKVAKNPGHPRHFQIDIDYK